MPDPFIRNLCVSWPFEDCEQANDATCILPMEEDVEKYCDHKSLATVLISERPGGDVYWTRLWGLCDVRGCHSSQMDSIFVDRAGGDQDASRARMIERVE